MPLPPSLTRQNAFYLEDDQINTPLDPMCAMCFEHAAVNDSLIRPCRCNMVSNRALYAHKKCFKNWLIANQYPKRCTRCQAKYTIFVSPPYKKRKRVFHILLSTLFLVMLLYFFLHLQHCTTIQVLTKDEVLKTDFGDNQLKNVPDNLVIPRISRSCLRTRYASISDHFVSLTHCIFITTVSFAISCFCNLCCCCK